ncbi:MAG: hypothetical protein A2087_11340 [Spirochaetes bacterium GWD1_61_31]|nr:MAG: hypothetical protein A2Y37_01340 [Spirochaetes bacterium GWB1_60_80]OHD28550.1 MAG: hypothetical protein A2004_07070 [Spirochaetes bacterium GWC1_61_12]OHD35711.1 MAG: hypothetical protein A2087_11340 [Spirochaetes bacterium GWD1_61_31]OHD41848.1 MAG: hypothetical protein A2Y35_04435 [Spirochaetes bacterium GWE1_60_18]OHD57828.1 MAG: hypothetical protein A2Y32_14130 [Spirochaetes bacterium GWF1_60_12]HAP42575.1 hypothetical protein [Spirochaetaceae bacterium]
MPAGRSWRTGRRPAGASELERRPGFPLLSLAPLWPVARSAQAGEGSPSQKKAESLPRTAGVGADFSVDCHS